MSTTASLSGTTLPPPSPLHQEQPPPPSTTYTPPPYTSFPPFYTLQPNTSTLARQLSLWTTYITTFCAHSSNRTFHLSPSSPIFANPTISRALKPTDIRTVLEYMSTPAGGHSVEFIPGEQNAGVWVWWRSPGEWADLLYGWVEGTGQKGAVLTFYELREESGTGKEWAGMEEGMLKKVLGVLVKRGKAQVFGEGGGEGVKFF